MISDSHMHTRIFSTDGRQTPEELIESAKKLGISNVSITEHYDMDYPHKDESFIFDLDKYKETFPKWQEYSLNIGGPKLLMGIEIGWQPHLNERIKETASYLPFDSVILSNHIYHGDDIYYSKDCALMPRQMRNREYIGTLARMCREIDDFDIAAHYDYINRYIEDPQSSVFYDDCPEEFDDFFDALISKDKALEINTSSINKQIKKGSPYIMPDPRIIKRYIDMGGKLFTIGSDAHDADKIGQHFDKTVEYLKSLGVKEIYYYEGRKPVSDPEFSRS
ncbi:MAG: histidinol-phosphatase HisJ family protein [Clostridiales bacterium]|nr:histidinol-phosphatase HisJ family protein [Clostridiales bacterium]